MKRPRDIVELEPRDGLLVGAPGAVGYRCVEISAEGAAEVDDRGRVVFVPRPQITRIALRRGIAAERPWVHAILGLLCFAAAWITWRIIAGWFAQGGSLEAVIFTGLGFLPLGIGIFWGLWRPRLFLRVETPKDVRHLIFRGPVEPAELRRFLEDVEATQGLMIEREAPGFDRATP